MGLGASLLNRVLDKSSPGRSMCTIISCAWYILDYRNTGSFTAIRYANLQVKASLSLTFMSGNTRAREAAKHRRPRRKVTNHVNYYRRIVMRMPHEVFQLRDTVGGQPSHRSCSLHVTSNLRVESGRSLQPPPSS